MLKLLTERATEVSTVLVVMVGARACAFPLHHVAETMRPLPIKHVAGTPGFVCGVSVIRGTPTPVVDLKALLENCENSPSYGRFVSLKSRCTHVAGHATRHSRLQLKHSVPAEHPNWNELWCSGSNPHERRNSPSLDPAFFL
jgi:purine-binding chemotaxis protein CheW